MISLGGEHPDHNHLAGFNPIKDFIVETMRLHPPKAAVIKRLTFGRKFKQMKRLTDFVKTHSGMDHQIPISELTEISRARLGATIARFRPQFLAFTSKNAGQRFLGGRRDYGEQTERIADTQIWILPSTSGAANGSWRPEIWHQFAESVRAGAG